MKITNKGVLIMSYWSLFQRVGAIMEKALAPFIVSWAVVQQPTSGSLEAVVGTWDHVQTKMKN